MNYRPLGKTGLDVSRLSYGGSSLGGVFHKVTEADGIQAVHTALDAGINYIDVSPAYGGTLAESVLGKALEGVPRSSYILSTKVGKTSAPGKVGVDTFDYSRSAIRRSLDESADRLKVDHLDIVHLHDIEYDHRKNTEWALSEGIETLEELKQEGRIGAIGIGMYPVDLWERVINEGRIDVGLTHNIYCLNDTRLLKLMERSEARGIGLINASPFACGLLTRRGAPYWHPATESDKALFARAAAHCNEQGEDIARLALQFACHNPNIPTTLFSSAKPESVRRNAEWSMEAPDPQLLQEVQEILAPIANQDWRFFE